MRKSLSGAALALVAALALGLPATAVQANGKAPAAKAKVMKKAKVAKVKKVKKYKRVTVRKIMVRKKRVAKVVVAHPHARIMSMLHVHRVLHVRPMMHRKHAKLAVWKKGKPGKCGANWAWVKSKRQCQDFRLK
jgi:hypothetical protein